MLCLSVRVYLPIILIYKFVVYWQMEFAFEADADRDQDVSLFQNITKNKIVFY